LAVIYYLVREISAVGKKPFTPSDELRRIINDDGIIVNQEIRSIIHQHRPQLHGIYRLEKEDLNTDNVIVSCLGETNVEDAMHS
jgi:hypothetical protein